MLRFACFARLGSPSFTLDDCFLPKIRFILSWIWMDWKFSVVQVSKTYYLWYKLFSLISCTKFTNGLFRHFVCFEKFYSAVSELIHLARCVKFNRWFILRIVLIVLCGTESNRRINFIPRLAGFIRRLALIGFPGTGAGD